MTSSSRSTLEAILMLRYNRDLWDIFFVDRLVLKNEAHDDAAVDNSDDEELERWMTKEMSSKIRLNLLSVFPQIHLLSITEDMFAGRAKGDDGTLLRDLKTYHCATLSSR